MNRMHDDYDVETEAALSGLASRVARGHSPAAMAQGIIELFATTDADNRWRRRELARIFAEISERVAASEHPDAEGYRQLGIKLRDIEAANK